MSQTSSPQFEWVISGPGDHTDRVSTQGPTAEAALGNLFAAWLGEMGDVSTWPAAATFGAVVYEHSDLDIDVVAAWLGINFLEILRADDPESPDGWLFRGPDGRWLELSSRRLWDS